MAEPENLVRRLDAMLLQLEALAGQVASLRDDLAAQAPHQAAMVEPTCQHRNRTPANTMGGGPLREFCRDCGAPLQDGQPVIPSAGG